MAGAPEGREHEGFDLDYPANPFPAGDDWLLPIGHHSPLLGSPHVICPHWSVVSVEILPGEARCE